MRWRFSLKWLVACEGMRSERPPGFHAEDAKAPKSQDIVPCGGMPRRHRAEERRDETGLIIAMIFDDLNCLYGK